MNQEQARDNMIKQQVRTWEVSDPRVVAVLYKFPREEFVPESWRELAYSDTNIVINETSCMLFPGMEARMLQALNVQSGERVLELGTGCAYMTALLTDLSGDVISLDTNDCVQSGIRENLKNVQFEKGSLIEGWQDKGSFDVIVLNGSVQSVPQGLLEKLNPGGRLFAVIGERPAMSATLIKRSKDQSLTEEILFETSLPRLQSAAEEDIFSF
ncbi:MAG: protein-L-isoaspartate O-methyltransferase [Gammaproteobacteria bacterium]|nr:protein-L-isoaspartate O-methyltransferase [Gammaproteobacteria bacterium]MDX2488042.1 protein-L-isoaspartate O-methyltransferase [Gammaproteobacteria bacterium]